MCLLNIWDWLELNLGAAILGAVIAIVFSWVLGLIGENNKQRLYKRLYSRYEDDYESHLKDKDKNLHHFDITLTREGNKFIVNGISKTGEMILRE